MSEYRYKLENGSKKHHCPNCNKKRFVRYIDTETGEILPDDYGRCDRESKCGYHLNPYKNGYAERIREREEGNTVNWKLKAPTYKPKAQPKIETAFIPISELVKTLRNYDKNIFIQNLLNKVEFPFDAEEIEKIISLYRLGTNAKNGAICFPFIDIDQNIRAVQEKIFDDKNHTDKSKKYNTSWLHSRLQYSHYRNKILPDWLKAYLNNDTKVSCLFGEHLLNKYTQNPVALVEAPKTAIYGMLYFGFPEQPGDLLWLAVFNLSSLTYEKCKVLKGRDVYLFPDASKEGTAFKDWSNKANDLQSKLSGTYFKVSNLLERLAPNLDKEQGNDLADYLIKQDWKQYREQEAEPKNKPKPIEIPPSEKSEKNEASNKPFIHENEIQPKVEVKKEDCFFDIKKEQIEDWSNDIEKLEAYFENTTIINKPVQLNQCTIITDCHSFINSHLTIVKANNGNRTFITYLNRLHELKEILNINSKLI